MMFINGNVLLLHVDDQGKHNDNNAENDFDKEHGKIDNGDRIRIFKTKAKTKMASVMIIIMTIMITIIYTFLAYRMKGYVHRICL